MRKRASMARIAFLLPDFGGGGAERVALTIMEELLARGHMIDLVLCRAKGELLESLPAEVRLVDLGATRFRRAIVPLIDYLRRERPDALQASMWPLTIIAIMASRIARISTRIVVSDHTALSRACAGKGAVFKAFLRQSIRGIYPLATRRIAVSAGVKSDLVQFGLEPGSIDIVYNPVNLALEGCEEPFDWPGDGLRILSVGRLDQGKNHDLLIRAFARVTPHLDASLVICGEGELRGELSALASRLGIADRVFLPGFLPNVGSVYGAADLYVQSSDREGYPLALVEALQAGLPVVATDCDFGPREILDGGRFGTLVPVGDEECLSRAILDCLVVSRNPQAQRQRAADLSGPGLIDRYEELLLGKLITRGPNGAEILKLTKEMPIRAGRITCSQTRT